MNMEQLSQQENFESIRHRPHPDDVVDAKKILLYFLRNWYWFILSICIAVVISWLYLQNTLKVWKTSATILIEEGNRNQHQGTRNLTEGYGLNAGMQNIENQIVILSSWNLVEKALTGLSFDMDYYYMGKFSKQSLYKKSPFKVLMTDPLNPISENVEFRILIRDNNQFQIIAEDNKIIKLDRMANWGDTIKVGDSGFLLEKTDYWPPESVDQPFYFTYRSLERLVQAYIQRLEVEPVSHDATILEVSLEGTNPERDRDLLKNLTESLLMDNLDKKNREAERIITFIEKQLTSTAESLSLTENRLQSFRSRNRVMNISAQGTTIMENAVKLEDTQAKLNNEANYYNYLMEYLKKDNKSEKVIAPATLGIEDPQLVRLVENLSDLNAEYSKFGVTEKSNPMQVALVQQIRTTKSALVETLQGIIRANELAVSENTVRLKELNQQAASLPVQERELLGIERQFKLTDALYTLLLEKQAEARLQKASNSPDNEIISSARTAAEPAGPKDLMVYFIGLFAGLSFPTLVLLLIKELDDKIRTEEDIKSLTPLPIIGHIPHNKHKTQTVVFDNPKEGISEAFRSLRTRVKFIIKDTSSPVILVTSSIPGEGKSFTALNLASTYSLTGKNTVIIGGDLRRPTIGAFFDISQKKGLSTWLIGMHNLDEVIQTTKHEQLYVIPAGPVPPNPSELLNHKKLCEFISLLKERFDYIIIDSAPIGIVSDSYAWAEVADATIMLVRGGKSVMKILKTTLADINASGLNHANIVVNDLRDGGGSIDHSYLYRNSAKYGYSSK